MSDSPNKSWWDGLTGVLNSGLDAYVQIETARAENMPERYAPVPPEAYQTSGAAPDVKQQATTRNLIVAGALVLIGVGVAVWIKGR